MLIEREPIDVDEKYLLTEIIEALLFKLPDVVDEVVEESTYNSILNIGELEEVKNAMYDYTEEQLLSLNKE